MAWFEEWFGQEYLDLYAHRDDEEAERHLDLVERLFGSEPPRAVLDLACGAGRHTQALRARGIRTLGIDLSLTLLTRPPAFPRVNGDIRQLPFVGSTFDWVLNFFTSFGYFEHERQNFQVLEEIVRVLTPGGRFLIDLFNRERVIANLVAHEEQERDGRRIVIDRWFDEERQRVNKRIRIAQEGARERSFLESVRAYREEEVVIGMSWAGLEVDGVYGSFSGDSYQRDSERLILVGRKPA